MYDDDDKNKIKLYKFMIGKLFFSFLFLCKSITDMDERSNKTTDEQR